MLQQSAMFKYLKQGGFKAGEMELYVAHNGQKIKGVLTKEDVVGKDTVSVISCDIHDDDYPHYYFYTDDYCMGLNVFTGEKRLTRHYWGSSSIDNRSGDADKYFRNCQLIESMDELLKILNDDLI